jgi:hypothetical protein
VKDKGKLPPLVHNWVSYSGAVIAGVSGLLILFLLITSLISGLPNPYLGILLFLVLPAMLIAGLVLIPFGMYVRWRAHRTDRTVSRNTWPSLDLNDGRQRNAALIFVLGSLIFILMSTVGLYQAYRFTDSVTFCAKTCHSVMKPEYSTFQRSPHARLKCVECHIGPGAGWYARSKLSGLYQVYAVLADIYPRPIPNPIKNLRPVQEDCELCHWPLQFFGQGMKRFDHYLYDNANTHWSITMLVKTGGLERGRKMAGGIHWHTDRNIEVDYAARDTKRQDIPWVRVTNLATGKRTLYKSNTVTQGNDGQGTAGWRRMDCIDCHNHPSHTFNAPDYEIDRTIYTGLIDAGIPEIKKIAVAAMEKKYSSVDEAMDKIETFIRSHYKKNYPEFFAANRDRIENAIRATQSAFSRNIFPSMKARWSNYRDNAGHLISPGCMRCHDGNHKSDDGSIIPHDCRTCHIILFQGKGQTTGDVSVTTGVDFRHPVDIGGMWKSGACYQCHDGTRP